MLGALSACPRFLSSAMRACASVLTVKHDVIDDLSVTSARQTRVWAVAPLPARAPVLFLSFFDISPARSRRMTSAAALAYPSSLTKFNGAALIFVDF